MLPRAGGNRRVAVPQINAGKTQVHRWLPGGLIHGDQQSNRFNFVARFEAFLHASGFFFDVEHTPGTTDQTECLLHCFTHAYECVRSGVPRISEQWTSYSRAVAGF